MTKEDRCIQFLNKNGWTADDDHKTTDEYLSFHKNRCLSVDIGEDEIVFIDETGDILHIPIDYYALVGAMFEFRQIGCNYYQVRFNGKNIKTCPLIGEECEKYSIQVGDMVCDGCKHI